MAKYFKYFPKTFYTSDNSSTGVDSVTNIISRFAFENQLKENSTAFYPYQIQDSDTPEIIADKYYDSSERHWVVLLFNDIIDPQFDWPLNSRVLVDYVDQKYKANGASNTTVQTGLAWAMSTNNIQAYFKVITTTSSDNIVTINKYQIDSNTYANTAATTNNYITANNENVTVKVSKETRSFYEYELEENEKKREIKLIKKEFVPEIEKEFRKVIRA
jgi:hypothetical protein